MDRSEILARVRQSIIEVVPEAADKAITEDSQITTLGIDSLKFVELGVRVEAAFGGAVSLDAWADAEAQRDGDSYQMRSLVDFIQAATAK